MAGGGSAGGIYVFGSSCFMKFSGENLVTGSLGSKTQNNSSDCCLTFQECLIGCVLFIFCSPAPPTRELAELDEIIEATFFNFFFSPPFHVGLDATKAVVPGGLLGGRGIVSI